uniref:Uncharacterized protein n=1 Tax=Anopheles coluzzii TaxID=1518534 RepID=A0A8W7PX66_ANOCL
MPNVAVQTISHTTNAILPPLGFCPGLTADVPWACSFDRAPAMLDMLAAALLLFEADWRGRGVIEMLGAWAVLVAFILDAFCAVAVPTRPCFGLMRGIFAGGSQSIGGFRFSSGRNFFAQATAWRASFDFPLSSNGQFGQWW